MNEPRNIFSEGFIRLTQPSVLNDPFEAAYCKASLDELTKYFDYGLARDGEFGYVEFSEYIELRMNNIGVISLSENKENLLMWAHYANEHKGLVVGLLSVPGLIPIFENLFRADAYINSSWGEEYSPFDGNPKPISYRKGLRYRNDKFDYDYSNIDAEGADRILYEVFMQKSDEWIYEQEHRIVLRLEQADRVILEKIDLITNERTRNEIKKASCTSVDKITGRIIVDLYTASDDNERMFFAMELAKLGRSPSVIYLMKLNSSSINNCLIGLRSKLDKNHILGGHASSSGRLDVWKARRNLDYYSLEFEQI